MHRAPLTLTLIAAVLAAPPALAQTSNVSPSHKFSWSENCGWINWRDAGAPAASQGVHIGSTFLTGFAWSENVGWINFGDGTPANAASYANATGADFGVNIDPGTGNLGGLAWGENIGWINFSLPSLPVAQRPRLDKVAARLRGYAWGENIGWINLDDATHYVSTRCPADYNDNGQVSVQDIFDFLADYFGAVPLADFNANGQITVQDIFDFLAAYFAGCP